MELSCFRKQKQQQKDVKKAFLRNRIQVKDCFFLCLYHKFSKLEQKILYLLSLSKTNHV